MNCSGHLGGGGLTHRWLQVGERHYFVVKNPGGIPEVAVFCEDMKFAAGGTIVVALADT